MLGCASLSMVWWVIFKNILHQVTKQHLNHYGHERGVIKETKKVLHLPVLLDLKPVPNNVFQILLNPPCQFFSNTFRRASDHPTTCPGNYMQKLVFVFDLCMSQTDERSLLLWWEKFEVTFSSHKISHCSKLLHFDGATLNNFSCVYLTHTEMHL